MPVLFIEVSSFRGGGGLIRGFLVVSSFQGVLIRGVPCSVLFQGVLIRGVPLRCPPFQGVLGSLWCPQFQGS